MKIYDCKILVAVKLEAAYEYINSPTSSPCQILSMKIVQLLSQLMFWYKLVLTLGIQLVMVWDTDVRFVTAMTCTAV